MERVPTIDTPPSRTRRAARPTQEPARPVRPPTVDTVAERAGVSRQTVSNVLNAPERVLPATRQRVQAVIDELGYRPNRLGSALQSRVTRTFGYRCHLSEDEENLLLDRFLHDLCRAAAARNHYIVLVSPPTADDELSIYHDMYRTGSVDGFVLSGTFPGDARLGTLRGWGVPVVSFGRDWDHPDAGGWVDIDGATGIAEAVEHFWSRGHRAIAWLGGASGGAGEDRRSGYRSATRTHGLAPVEIECAHSIEAAAEAAGHALDGPQPPTAFVCATDVLAVGCARAAAARHLDIGGDVGIIGFDDTRLALATSPPLSSIRQPTEHVAELLIDALIGAVAGTPPPSAMLAPRLVHRGSS